MSDSSDAELMIRVCAGDEGAFSILVRRHIDPLYNYALRLCRSPATAEDLVQETWLTAWQKARSYRANKARLNTWLYRILHNKCVDMQRKKQPDYDQDVVDAAPGTSETTQLTHSSDIRTWLERALDELPENQRAALVLAHVQGFSNKEVATIMRISVRAAESLLARGRAALRARPDNPTHTPTDS